MAFFRCKFGWWLMNKFSLLFLISFILDARGRVFSRFVDRFTVPMSCTVGYWVVTIVPYLLALSSYSPSFATQNPKRCKSSTILQLLSEFPNQSSITVEHQSSQRSEAFKPQAGQSGSKFLSSLPASINCCCDTRLSWLRYCRCIIAKPERRLHLYVCGEICVCCVCCLDDSN